LKKIRILLADDHAILRQGTRQLLEHESDIEVIGEASDGLQAVKLTGELCRPSAITGHKKGYENPRLWPSSPSSRKVVD
jgi:CheY-like chemotaxis protein